MTNRSNRRRRHKAHKRRTRDNHGVRAFVAWFYGKHTELKP